MDKDSDAEPTTTRQIGAAAEVVANWIAARPERGVTLRMVQREAPNRAARRDALAVLSMAEALGLLVQLAPGSLVAGVPRTQAWASTANPDPHRLPDPTQGIAQTVRHGNAEACDTEGGSVRHEPLKTGVRHVKTCDADGVCDTTVPPDAARLLDHLRRTGPATHREAAAALGWQANRASRTADRLCREGLVSYPTGGGTMHPKP